METKIDSTETANDPIFIRQDRRKGFTMSQASVVSDNSMDALYLDESQAKQLLTHLKSIFEPENDAKVKALEEIVKLHDRYDFDGVIGKKILNILEQRKLI